MLSDAKGANEKKYKCAFLFGKAKDVRRLGTVALWLLEYLSVLGLFAYLEFKIHGRLLFDLFLGVFQPGFAKVF